MKKPVLVILIAAALVVVGILIWKAQKTAGQAAAGAPKTPDAPPLPAQLANAFSTLLGSAVNTTAQWFSDRLSTPSRGVVTEKPTPVNGKGPTVSVPAGSTPNVVNQPTYFA